MNNSQAGSETGKDLTAVLELLPGLTRKDLETVRAKAGELEKTKAGEERRAALREIQRLAREHGLKLDVGEPKGKRGRPAKAKEAV